MTALGPVLLLLRLIVFVMDIGMLFLAIRLLVYVFPAKPLVFLNKVGRSGVEIVTGAVAYHVKRFCRRPLSRRQEEVAALLVLMVLRLAIAALAR